MPFKFNESAKSIAASCSETYNAKLHRGVESITTCVILSNSGIEPSQRSNARREEPLPLRHLLDICIINDLIIQIKTFVILIELTQSG